MNEWVPKPGSITTYDNAVAEWFVVRYKNRSNSLIVRNDAYKAYNVGMYIGEDVAYSVVFCMEEKC